jgi:hypothetical protein
MADIIRLDAHANRRPAGVTRNADEPVTIIIFPGVRYEKPTKSQAAPGRAPRSGNRKRRKMN